MCCKKYFYDKFIEIINQWKEDEIAAISILVYSNETYVYKGIKNFFEISIGYIQKDDKYDSDDVKGLKVILNAEEDDETAEIILEFLVSNGVKNIGSEDFEKSYDENMNYIGKGPNGYYEVLNMISEVARDLQLHGIVNKKFGKIPIIIHDLEYSWYSEEATILANPNNEAKEFIEYFREKFEVMHCTEHRSYVIKLLCFCF